MNLPLTNADRSRDRRACAVPPWGCPWPRQPAAALQRAASPVLARANTLSSGRPTSGDAADAPHTEPFRRYRQNGQRRGPETRYLQVIRERSGAGVEPTNRGLPRPAGFEDRMGHRARATPGDRVRRARRNGIHGGMTDHPTTITLIGGPTAVLTYGGLRILTDPTFDPPGEHPRPGTQVVLRKLTGPALAADDVLPVDLVLLSHDHHADNLDVAGRAFLPSASSVLTTTAGAGRLGGNAVGLEPDQTAELHAPDAGAVHITAVARRAWLTRGGGEERPRDRVRPAGRGPADDLRQRRQRIGRDRRPDRPPARPVRRRDPVRGRRPRARPVGRHAAHARCRAGCRSRGAARARP